jgi:anti-sigma regulatory factor (Ser/Thr protein kinase)
VGATATHDDAFRHEALLFRDEDELLATTLPYLRRGVEAGEAAVVLAPAPRRARLRELLGAVADRVRFEATEPLGPNPARLIPFWARCLGECAAEGRRLCAACEALPPGSGDARNAEFDVHESLVNVAFGAGPGWTLLCPYDVSAHRADTIEQVRVSHPFVTEHGTSTASTAYRDAPPFAGELSPAPSERVEIAFSTPELGLLRTLAAEHARRAGMGARAGDLELAVTEIATNSIRHGGGHGVLRIWHEDGALTCEIRDAGRLRDPLLGRVKPYGEPRTFGGAGVWLANHLCDLVQVRSGSAGTTVRLQLLPGTI